LVNLLSKWWTTEYFGCAYDSNNIYSRDDKRAIDILESTTRKVGERYETSLLWKSDNVVLPDNRLMAEKRLHNLESRLDRYPVLKEAYANTVLSDLEKGYARVLSDQRYMPYRKRL
jgi:hypothetical protein